MAHIYEFQKQKIKLDVGGHKFSTARSTLLTVHGSLLERMFSGSYPLEKDEEDGSFFIDRDGRQFHHILNYLRDTPMFDPPREIASLRELAKEAEYYKLVFKIALAFVP